MIRAQSAWLLVPSSIMTRSKNYTPPSPEERYYAFGRIKYFDTFRRKERTTTYCFAVDIKDFITKSRNAYIATQKTHFESPVIFDFAPQHNDAD
jgi:hypothetical protein